MQQYKQQQQQQQSGEQSEAIKVPTDNLANRPATVDRRTGLDRRTDTATEAGYTGVERRATEQGSEAASEPNSTDESGLHRRRGPGVRRSVDRRSAEEGEMTGEQFEFVMAVETYKKVNKRMYPTWTEILEVLSRLGYRKVMARDIVLENVPEPTLWSREAEDAAIAAAEAEAERQEQEKRAA